MTMVGPGVLHPETGAAGAAADPPPGAGLRCGLGLADGAPAFALFEAAALLLFAARPRAAAGADETPALEPAVGVPAGAADPLGPGAAGAVSGTVSSELWSEAGWSPVGAASPG